MAEPSQSPALSLPSLTVKWGSYAKPDPDEESKIVTTVRTAFGGGATGGQPLITKRAAVEKLAPVFGIENVTAFLEALEEEAEEKAKADAEQSQAELEQMHALANGGQKPTGQRGAPPPGAGAGSNAPGAAPPKAPSGNK